MFNRAAFNRAAFNRPADTSGDINYNAILTAQYGQESRLTAYLSHMVIAVENTAKALQASAGIITDIAGATETESSAELTASIEETVLGAAGVELNVILTCHYSVFVSANALFAKTLFAAAGYYGGLTMTSTMSAELAGAADMITSDEGEAEYEFEGDGCADDVFTLGDTVSVNADCVLILDYKARGTAEAIIKAASKLGANYKAPFAANFRNGYATVNAYISSQTAIDYVFEINCTIPAGATIIIDSENFTVTIDGENVLYAQNGEWIILSRNTQQISLDVTDFANTDSISGNVKYRSRFL